MRPLSPASAAASSLFISELVVGYRHCGPAENKVASRSLLRSSGKVRQSQARLKSPWRLVSLFSADQLSDQSVACWPDGDMSVS